MGEFFKFLDGVVTNQLPMHVEIYYSKVTDWSVCIYRKGALDNGEDQKIAYAQSCDIELCFAKAHVQLKEWLLENRGGY